MKRNIYTYGNDLRLDTCRKFLEDAEFAGDNVHILPIPSTKDGKTINGTDISFDDFLFKTGNKDVVVGYAVPKDYCAKFVKEGVTVIDVSEDAEYLEIGAKMTALGFLGRIITREKRILSDLKFGIIGYGRIGKYLSQLLTFVGADVTVFTSRPALREDLSRLGIKTVGNYELTVFRRSIEFESPFSKLDILVNTAPAKVLSDDDAQDLRGVKIYELASGENIPKALEHEKMPSIPALMFPESAGIAYAKSALKFIIKVN